MPAQSKYEMLEKVNKSLDASQGLFVVDYRGLTVKETQEFRRSLREVGASMKVYKNNIVKIAL
ncbi:MAG: 50S ribosomal protein L10, partial [Atopobiaceae bacterium]|nr:50S ribosomal protein L10 [Atopobiaceae bacterium]